MAETQPLAAQSSSLRFPRRYSEVTEPNCHAPHPANLTDAKWEHGGTDGEIFTTIKMGVPPKFDMDSWDGRIPDKDIWNLVNYIRTLGPKTAARPAAKK